MKDKITKKPSTKSRTAGGKVQPDRRSSKPDKTPAKVKSAPPKKAPVKSAARKQVEGNLIPVAIKTHTDKNDGHPHVIMEDIEDKHVSVGLSTQKKKGKSKKSGTNYTLEKSPLDDGKTSYMRRQGTVASKKEYKNPRDGTMTSKDYAQAKIYAERAKQKHLKEKKGKKK